MPRPARAPIRDPESFASYFSVSRETGGRLQAYVDLLKQWQPTINLVAPSTLEDAWERHIVDSAQLFILAPSDAMRWLDLGSGAGFPGMVLALMLAERPGARMTLIESDQRKSAFLAEVARKTGAPVDILSQRIEKVATQAKVGPYDVVTARALAPLPKLFELAIPYFSSATTGLFPKGREAEAEIRAARTEFDFDLSLQPSLTDEAGRVLKVTALRRAADRTDGP
jgi:16S rRNA (guanine527-N7)-methyltransferase